MLHPKPGDVLYLAVLQTKNLERCYASNQTVWGTGSPQFLEILPSCANYTKWLNTKPAPKRHCGLKWKLLIAFPCLTITCCGFSLGIERHFLTPLHITFEAYSLSTYHYSLLLETSLSTQLLNPLDSLNNRLHQKLHAFILCWPLEDSNLLLTFKKNRTVLLNYFSTNELNIMWHQLCTLGEIL